MLEVLKTSELYDEHFDISLCLNEGIYPKLIKAINGPAFGHGFYNVAHISSEIDVDKNTAVVNGYNWQLDQLIIHEIIHTYQYNEFGIRSKYHALWKVEGYAEYIARQSTEPLQNQIVQLQSHRADSDNISWEWVEIYENSGVPLDYLHNHTLVRYMMEIVGMTYKELISDSSPKAVIDRQMLSWLKQNRNLSF